MSNAHKRIQAMLPSGAKASGLCWVENAGWHNSYQNSVMLWHAQKLIEHAAMVYLMGRGWSIHGGEGLKYRVESQSKPPCSPSCYSHMTHPCERCGKKAGQYICRADTLADALLAAVERDVTDA